ncbi:hypothetical protein ACWENQ_43665 [Nonomuraea sp. NPDC004354]
MPSAEGFSARRRAEVAPWTCTRQPAWERLTEREPPYVAAERTEDYSKGPYLLRLTDAGTCHHAEQWQAYARLYPAVNAPTPMERPPGQPRSTPAWPR